MAAEYGGERGWSVERCYMLREDYDRVMTLPEHSKSGSDKVTLKIIPEIIILHGITLNEKQRSLRYGVPGFTLDFP